MARTTSVSLGEHFESFIEAQIASGRYGTTSEVIRAALRLLEEYEQKKLALRQALLDGESSGDGRERDMQGIENQARRRAGSRGPSGLA